ncbi:hypothetical protein F5Y03DRAFT_405633 [Xylaria venustula]|nr:hypothetical protein F5Y03DRAFT_405633 [Xylaria venustula]
MGAQQQCYDAEVNNSNIVEHCRCDSARLPFLGRYSSNTLTAPQTFPGNIGIIALSDNSPNAGVLKEDLLSLDSQSTVDDGDELTTNGSVTRRHTTHRHAAKKKFNSILCIEIIAPILGCVILLVVAYFLFRARKRRQEKHKKEESDESAMEMGNMGRREEQNPGTIGASAMPKENLLSGHNPSDISHSTSFTRPRRAPFPPPASPPPDRPLPPLPVRGGRHASMVSRGRGNRNRMGVLHQWPLADGVNLSPSDGNGPGAFGLSHVRQQ